MTENNGGSDDKDDDNKDYEDESEKLSVLRKLIQMGDYVDRSERFCVDLILKNSRF